MFVLFCKPSATFASVAPFTKPTISNPATLIDFKGVINGNRVMLQWTVQENETADQFIVEKSTDGRNFKMAALVFGTDRSETDHYMFYEKANHQKTMYRITTISKNHKAEYSSILAIAPKSAN